MTAVTKHVLGNLTIYQDTNHELHRDDGPAKIWHEGGRSWWKHGMLHRIGGPAIDGTTERTAWFIDGKEYNEYDYWHIIWGYYASETASAWLAAHNAFRIL